MFLVYSFISENNERYLLQVIITYFTIIQSISKMSSILSISSKEMTALYLQDYQFY
ncbi:hypothetical protein GM3708_127 [Geminocystis sp. NIES-3708]|nr:hypothetical protein GM3708_127 [Geminocystis sp. NIES-3708]